MKIDDTTIKQIQMIEFDINQYLKDPLSFNAVEYFGDIHLEIQSLMASNNIPLYTKYNEFTIENLIKETDERGYVMHYDEARSIMKVSFEYENVEEAVDEFIRANEF